MTMDITRLFQEKNYEILLNKLNLDINNNADSLNHTMNNFIDLKEISLNKYISEIYNNANIKYDEKQIKDIILIESDKLKELFLKFIKDRQERILSFFDREVDVTKISDDYINEYHEYIDELTDDFNHNIEVGIRDEICTEFSKEIIKLYKLPEESSREQLMEYINKSYCNSLIEKIESEATLRNTTLKNLSKEAFERFKSMNENTIE